MKILAALLLSSAMAMAQNPYGNQFLPTNGPIVMTATSQTSAPVSMGQSWSAGVIQLTGTSLTTATFGVLASTDNGSHYFAVPICTVAATPVCATTQTATANAQFTVNLLGATYIEYVTSGTFTGTNINLLLTASPNASAKNSSGGGTTYTGTIPVVVTGTVISCPTCSTGGSGSLVLLAEVTAANGDAQLDVTTRNVSGQSGNLFQADYDLYQGECLNLIPATTNAQLGIQVFTAGGIDATNNYSYAFLGWVTNTTAVQGSNAGINTMLLTQGNVPTIATPVGVSGTLKIQNPASTTLSKNFVGPWSYRDASGEPFGISFMGQYLPTTALTGIRFKFFTSINLNSGTCRFYGIEK